MIISISIENWMSFRDPVTFSMVASRERQHGHRLPKLNKYNTRVLPIAAIYGGNASGKTNFFKALSFTKSLVVKGTSPDAYLPVDTFRLDDKSNTQAARFCFELLIDNTIYEFSFALTRKSIIEERLVEIKHSSERVIYDRQGAEISFDASLKKDEFLKFAFRGTRDNQLFLHNAVSQKVDLLRPVYDWFKYTLELVAPDTLFEPFDVFLELCAPSSKKVFVIDEIDRSLHSILVRRLLDNYLDRCSDVTRSQLLFTTHDIMLIDQKLLRRDEMWVTERHTHGVSTIFSFSEFKDVRYDKDIRKSYLQGRLGGIPRIAANY